MKYGVLKKLGPRILRLNGLAGLQHEDLKKFSAYGPNDQ